MKWPLTTARERQIALGLLLLWALLFLPHLRTNPNWYGDEGDWMDPSWTLAHGHPRHGPLKVDFLFPYPYPPFFLAINGALLRVFGNDVVVGRALQAATALAGAALLVWVGTQLRDRNFGFLCAAAFLVYPEVVTNFRWVHSHPMAGVITIAAVGFLVRYVHQKRQRDIVWAGLLCSLATATSYWSYGLIFAVIITSLLVNWRHVAIAGVCSLAYLACFSVAYVLVYDDGLVRIFQQVERLTYMTAFVAEQRDTWGGELGRIGGNLLRFCFWTWCETRGSVRFIDPWLACATIGVLLFPSVRFRKWLIVWLVALMFAVFKARNSVSTFTYPATIFLPLMAVGFAGAMVRLNEMARHLAPLKNKTWSYLPAALFLCSLGAVSLHGSLGHFRTKVDALSVQDHRSAEAVMEFVNARTAEDEFVILPFELFWLCEARKAHMVESLAWEGEQVWPFAAPVPRESFWFDCHWRNATYLVLAAGPDEHGIDAQFWLNMNNVRALVGSMRAEHWPVVFQRGPYLVFENPRRTP